MKDIIQTNGKTYYKVPNYSMKCRLYPNKTAAACIDRIINGVAKAYNIATYDMVTNLTNTTEYVTEDGKVYHNIDYRKVINKDYLNWLRQQHPDIPVVPASALSGKNGLFLNDHKKAMSHRLTLKKTKTGLVKKTHEKKARTGKGGGYNPYPLEMASVRYYNTLHPRTSYTYGACLSTTIHPSDNRNVFYIMLTNVVKVGDDGKEVRIPVKVRGWNQNIRFGENAEMDFLEAMKASPKNKQFTITISKDNCGDYWIVFKLADVYKESTIVDQTMMVGVDMGIESFATTSDGTKYEHKRFKHQQKKHIKYLGRRLSRRQGPSNIKFREARKSDRDLETSKSYEELKIKKARLERKVARQRDNYMHVISKDLIDRYQVVAMETLNIEGMLKNKHIAYTISDASWGTFFNDLKYKGDWYGREVLQIGQFDPSSKRCSCCGYIRPKLPLSVRAWTCPECNTHHDRDVNAAKNMLFFALNKHAEETA